MKESRRERSLSLAPNCHRTIMTVLKTRVTWLKTARMRAMNVFIRRVFFYSWVSIPNQFREKVLRVLVVEYKKARLCGR